MTEYRPVLDRPGPTDPPAPDRWRGLAVAAVILALLGLVTCGSGSVVGIVLGHMARRRIRLERRWGGDETGAGRARGSGEWMARAGILIGWSGVALYAVVTALLVALIVWARAHPDGGGGHHSHFGD